MGARTILVQFRVSPEELAQIGEERGGVALSEHCRTKVLGPSEDPGARQAGWARRLEEWPVSCPTCHASAGGRCKRVEGARMNRSGWHPARWEALPEARREAVSVATLARLERETARGGGR